MQIFAHRGVIGRNADENSIEAVRRAVAMGVDGIEVDIRCSRDDEAVLVHDPDLRRIAGDIRQVADLSVKELLDVPLRHGSRVATLDDLTANVPAPIALDLEVKDKDALDLMIRKLKTSTGLRDRTILSSFSQDVIELASHDLPDVRRLILMRAWPVRFRFFIEWVNLHGLYGVGFLSRFWTSKRVDRIHAHGLKAVAWEQFGTRSARGRAHRLLAAGIDIIIANQPAVYQRIRSEEQQLR
ncbi:MAG TPA: glycerophosphodiester phosphodiesterase [Candidatus Methylomirabilis sp.]|nr:glycerophosphodiester phosphodiesterase [Candidatus Methylomirabilis sp.]